MDELRTKIERLLGSKPDVGGLTAEAKPAAACSRSSDVRVSSYYLEPDHVHGRIRLDAALMAESELIAKLALDPGVRNADLKGALYLDTETTGLGSGAGTVPFLIGLGWFEDESFVVEQLFLEELGQEGPMLDRLRSRIEQASVLVTYNGKAYDYPLLVSRYVMNRRPPPAITHHVDLLHLVRRVYRRRLRHVRLVDVEDQVLGMRRERDIDGQEIPGLYWSFLRHKNSHVMEPVLEHNANDVVSMAAILAELSKRFSKVHSEDEPEDQLSRAKVAIRAQDETRGVAFAQAAAEGGGPPEVTAEAYELMGTLARRKARYREAELAWRLALEACQMSPKAASIHLELAKLYEHRLKDLNAALTHAQRTVPAEDAEARGRRIGRLERKIKKAAVFAPGVNAGVVDSGVSL